MDQHRAIGQPDDLLCGVPDAQAPLSHLAITGLQFMVVGFSTFCFTLILHATQVRYGAGDERV